MGSRRSVVPRALTMGLLAAAALTALPRGGSIAAQERPAPESALRLSGVLRDGRIESLTAIPLEVVLPLTVREKVLSKGERPGAGVFLELNDGEGVPVFRVLMDDPTLVVMEYEDPNEPGRIVSKEIRTETASFSIIVPAPPKASSVRFLRVRPGQEAVPAAKRRTDILGTFPLRELRPEDGESR